MWDGIGNICNNNCLCLMSYSQCQSVISVVSWGKVYLIYDSGVSTSYMVVYTWLNKDCGFQLRFFKLGLDPDSGSYT